MLKVNQEILAARKAQVLAALAAGATPQTETLRNGATITTVAGIKHGPTTGPDATGHFRYGVLHSDIGPAVRGSDGSQWWYQDGLHHRDDGPAQTDRHGSRVYWRNGVYHRTDGPAVHWANGKEEWWENGKRIK